VGAKVQFDRTVKSPVNEPYHMSSMYGQIRHDLGQNMYAGVELNYSLYSGTSSFLSGISLSNDFGFGVLIGYIFDDLFFNVGYRLMNVKGIASGMTVYIQSNGLFFQSGLMF